MPVKETTLQQYTDIRQEHAKLINCKEFGVQKYDKDWVICKLARMFYKSPATIENIIYHRV